MAYRRQKTKKRREALGLYSNEYYRSDDLFRSVFDYLSFSAMAASSSLLRVPTTVSFISPFLKKISVGTPRMEYSTASSLSLSTSIL